MAETKYIVGSKIYRLNENSFRYLTPDLVSNVVTTYGTDMFEGVLNYLEIPQEFYDHVIWSNFMNATTVVRDLTGVGTNIIYTSFQSPDDNYTTYTLQLWPSEEEFNSKVAENHVAYENLRSTRTAFLSMLGLEMEIRKSYRVIDAAELVNYDQVKSIFENL
jgi:hypothetical protein